MDDQPTRVLIVDDDLFVRTALAQLLSTRKEIQVIGTFEDGAVAAAAAAEARPDVVLVDINMPLMEGPDAVRAVLAACPSAKVLALTSLTTQEAAAEMLAAGALGFLTKDTPVAAMVASVRAIHAGLTVLAGPAAGLVTSRRASPDELNLHEHEAEVLKLVATGLSNPEIAERLFLSLSTVKYLIATLMARLGAENRVQLAIKAHGLGLG